MNKWINALIAVIGLTAGNFGYEYFRATPDYQKATLESFNNAVGIITYIIVIAL
jgi:hypothetical protein